MDKPKKVCINIPCYNEEENVIPLCESLIKLFKEKLPEYNFIIQFIDNCSKDHTQFRIFELCNKYPFVRAIFNSKNFHGNSALYGLLQSEGDCTIYLSADFQDPIEKIPELLSKWEEGYLIVAAIKKTSKENVIKYAFRELYYKIMKRFSNINFIEQFCNFGVYDKKFIDIIRNLHNPNYSIRGNVAEYGYDIGYVEYEQQKRRSGKSKYNFWRLFNLGLTNFIDYTDILLRLATFLGLFFSVIFFGITLVFTIKKIMYWSEYAMGIAPILIGIFLTGSINMFLLGIIGEYILSVRKKVTDSPLVIEKTRINFENEAFGNTKIENRIILTNKVK